ncbi:hypothetical protein A5671_07760 [Mycolicibacter heraklionensis]|nr:hypothetical protein A5671_07760 [Mycolicibacter heraklionensis]
MPAVSIEPEDLAPFADIDEAKALEMIEDALGMAELVAPCILEDDFTHPRAAKAVLRGAILRWHEAGQGGVSQEVAGIYQQTIDTRTTRRAMFWPSEIEQLQSMCRDDARKTAYSIDVVDHCALSMHADVCSLVFGASFCSCGADLSRTGPLWECS